MYFFTLDEVIDACMAYMRAEFIPALVIMCIILVIVGFLSICALVKADSKKENKNDGK